MREPVLLMRAGSRRFALPIRLVDEVMRPLALAERSGAPAFVLGDTTIRGNLFAVIDLRRVLGIEQPSPPARMLTLRLPESRIALVVDEVLSVQNDTSNDGEQVSPLLHGAPHDLVEQIGAFDNGLLTALRAAVFRTATAPGAADGAQ